MTIYCLAYTDRLSSSVTAITNAKVSVSSVNDPQSSVFVSSAPVNKYIIPINNVDDDEFFVKFPIDVVLTDVGGEYIADFPEAQISVSEDSAAKALSWLKARIVGSYRRFEGQKERLGPVPMHQLRVLEKYIGKKSFT
jgi:hypothetical protein